MTISNPEFDKLFLSPELLRQGVKPTGSVKSSYDSVIIPEANRYTVSGEYDRDGINGAITHSGVVDAPLSYNHGAGFNYAGGTSGDHSALPVMGIFEADFTVVVVFRNNDGVAINKWFFTEGASPDLIVGFLNEGGKFGFLIRNEARENTVVTGITPTDDGKVHVAVVRGTYGASIDLYLDGVYQGGGGHPGGLLTPLYTTIGALVRTGPIEVEAKADIYFIGVLREDIGDARARDLSVNPYQLLKPKSTIAFPIAVAAGGVTPNIHYYQYLQAGGQRGL